MEFNILLFQSGILVFAAFVGAILSGYMEKFWNHEKLLKSLGILFITVIFCLTITLIFFYVVANYILNI